MDIPTYCREVESYLCRKNDGHLIRIVGPSFDRVSSWAARGIPIKIAFEGIDRYFERYYRSGPRRRPVKIDFCEADVLDVFDEWRRATGVIASVDASASGELPSGGFPRDEVPRIPNPRSRHGSSLPAHLERVLTRLSSLRLGAGLEEGFAAVLDRVAAELEEARASASGVRGEARAALLARLDQIDRDVVAILQQSLDDRVLADLKRDASAELAPFRSGMTDDVHERAHAAALARLIRSHFGLPTISYR